MRSLRPTRLTEGFAVTCVLVAAMFFGLHRIDAQSQPDNRMGLPQDWSHRHVVFSRPSDMPTLVAIRQDPRLLHQLLRRNALGLNHPLGANPTFGFNLTNPMNPPELTRAEKRLEGQQQMEEQNEDNGDEGERELDSEHRGRPTAQDKGTDWNTSLGVNGTHVPRNTVPAKFSFDINGTPDCTNDFIVFPTFHVGSATQATIVAYNNLYSSQNGGLPAGLCGTAGPSVKWAYWNTGGPVRNSPVLSLDGKKVAWVAGNGVVHVLTIGTTGTNGTAVNAPVIPGVAGGNNAVNRGITLSPASTVTSSSVWVDYTNDVAYVGDDVGVLHKIANIFNGFAVEVTTGGWPVTVNGGVGLTGPVLDSVTGNIFVTDNSGRLSYVREVGSTSGTCMAGGVPCRGANVLVISAGTPIVDSPIVDSTTGRVFTETAANGTNAVIVQADTALGSVVTVPVGIQDTAAANALHSGTFDDNYFNSVSTGFYYVCGKSPANGNPRLYRIGFNASGVMNSAPDAATILLASGRAQCSPAAEVFNAATDWLFVSVSNNCPTIGGGCLKSFNITTGMPATFTARSPQKAGTSGIVVDNVSPLPQASSIYFSNEGNPPPTCGSGPATGGCAVKLTQALLQ